jgi:hypothetical protein
VSQLHDNDINSVRFSVKRCSGLNMFEIVMKSWPIMTWPSVFGWCYSKTQ